MNGRNVLILGEPGAGKSTLARALVRLAPRVIVYDPEDDYTQYGDNFEDLASAAAYAIERYDSDLRLIYHPENDPIAEVDALLSVAEVMQAPVRKNGLDGPPLAFVIDESSTISSTFEISPQLRRIYTLGRRWRINLVTIAQVDTDVHRLTRRCSQYIVIMRQQSVSSDLARIFSPRDVQQLTPIAHPGIAPVQGVHFLHSPPSVQLFDEWENRLFG